MDCEFCNCEISVAFSETEFGYRHLCERCDRQNAFIDGEKPDRRIAVHTNHQSMPIRRRPRSPPTGSAGEQIIHCTNHVEPFMENLNDG